MMKWEYRIIKMDAHGVLGGNVDVTKLEESFNQLGKDGWEVIAAFDTNLVEGATRHVVAIFKRSISR